MSADIKSDMQDVLYGALIHERYDTSEQALDALMPHVDRYVAAELRRLVNITISDDTKDDVLDSLRTRADELDGGALVSPGGEQASDGDDVCGVCTKPYSEHCNQCYCCPGTHDENCGW